MTPREKSWPSSVHTGDPLAQNTEGREETEEALALLCILPALP